MTALKIDVSRYQRLIDFDAVKAWRGPSGDQIDKVIIRLGPGFDADAFSTRNYYEALRVGLPVEGYHVPVFPWDISLQLEALLTHARYATPSITTIWSDCERTNGVYGTALRNKIQAHLVGINGAGYSTGVYTSPGWWNTWIGWTSWAQYWRLWVAHYTLNLQPRLPLGWSRYEMWQYTNGGVIDGIRGRVDLNR